MLAIMGYDGTVVTSLQGTEVQGWLQQAGARIWINLEHPTKAEEQEVRTFLTWPPLNGAGWSPAAAYLHPTPRFITGYIPLPPHNSLIFCLGPQFLYTQQQDELRPLSLLWHTYQQELKRWPYGLDYLLYQLLDQLATTSLATLETYRAELTQPPPHTTPLPLTHRAHHLASLNYELQQWHSLSGQLAVLTHELLDANTNYHCRELQRRIAAQKEEVILLQNWITIHQQEAQTHQTQQTQRWLHLIVWLLVAWILIYLIMTVLLSL
ncbi:MAG: hypothetical protein KA314_03685 [Chloroflexi bacterium]|nr:hypothetical protein [Chloroflexota bacterium]MBP8054915.1 hypothetical protein [Chloroflexota bacterium]